MAGMNSSENQLSEQISEPSSAPPSNSALEAGTKNSASPPALQLPSPQLTQAQQAPAESTPPKCLPEVAPGLHSGADVASSFQSLLGTVVIAVFVITFIVQAFQIPSPSMENTLLVGDYLLVNKLCYGQGTLPNLLMPYGRARRGDIVVFHYPVNPAQHFVKRVVGIPGDRVRLLNKQVYVNGVALREPYARFTRPLNDSFRDNFPGSRCLRGRPRSGGCNSANWWTTASSLCPREITL